MDNLAGLGLFFAGLGIFFIGIGVLWWISIYDREIRLKSKAKRALETKRPDA